MTQAQYKPRYDKPLVRQNTNVSMPKSIETDSSFELRRKPMQQRSQDRLARIVAVAEEMAQAKGIAALSIREVAREAETNIASFYQFFPTKNALIRFIAAKYSSLLRENLLGTMADLDVNSIEASLKTIQTKVYGFYESNPIVLEIWPGTLSDLELRKFDQQDTEQNAVLLAELISQFRPDVQSEKVMAMARLLAYTIGPLFRRMAQLSDSEKQAVLALNLESTVSAIKAL